MRKELEEKATINFVSGKLQQINVFKFNNMPVELNKRGIKTMRDDDGDRQILIPLNSNTIEFIECKYIEIEEEVVPEPTETEILEMIKAEAEEVKAEVESAKDVEEKRKDQEADFMKRANCTHTQTTIFKKITGSGERFMPVCDVCGKRERYVKRDSLNPEDINNAKILED